MANSFFKFKEFTIYQDQCGMKVTTDACLFGALVAETIQRENPPARTLDIGTGTGLLTLMLAQASHSLTDAIEIDKNAFEQAKTNFTASPWSDRLKIFHSPFSRFSDTPTPSHLYDLIICNPPFFSKHIVGKDEAKNKALHDKGNLLAELPQSVDKLLSKTGQFYLLLPDYEMSVFSEQMEKSELYPQKEVVVHHKAKKPIFRRVVSFGREQKENIEIERLYIHDGTTAYSPRFTTLLKPYYLHL